MSGIKIEDISVGDMLITHNESLSLYTVTKIQGKMIDVCESKGAIYNGLDPYPLFEILIKGKITNWKEVIAKCGKTLQ